MWSWRDHPIDEIPPANHLGSLILRGDIDGGNTQQHLLNALSAPALRQLSVSGPEFDDPQATLISFLVKSRCSLDSLRIKSTALPESNYRARFPSIPVLRVYEDEDMSDDDEVEVQVDEDSDSDDSDYDSDA
jgi:hypothetical protein